MIITIRLEDTEENINFVESIKDFSSEQAITKALLSSSKKALFLSSQLSSEKSRREKSEDEVRRLSRIISDLDNSCRATLEITGQGDLLR